MQTQNDIIIARIQFLCDKEQISVNKLLQECNLNKSVIDNMKKGSVPATDKINIIANYFGVQTDFLLGNTDDPTPPNSKTEPIPEIGSVEWLRQGLLARGFDDTNLTEEDMERMLVNVDAMVEAYKKYNKK